MSHASKRLKSILLKNRASLGLSIIQESETESDIDSETETETYSNIINSESQKELIDLLSSLNLDVDFNQSSSSNIKQENKILNMENIRFHTSLLPTFSGIQNHLESFLNSIDEFYSLYNSTDANTNKVVLAAIKSKLIDNAREFLLSRPDLTTWTAIKEALRQKFGDPITYHILIQQLQYFKINKNENIIQFVDRIKSFIQRIVSKIQCEVTDNNSKIILLHQVQQTAVLILTANSPQTLKTMLMLQRPNTLDDAYSYVINYNMVESQVNFTYGTTLHNSDNINNNFNKNNNLNNQNKVTPVGQLQLQHQPVQFSQQPKFPSQPIFVQPRPVQRHYPTNAQVFGKPKNVFAPQNRPQKFQPPTPMSTSTAGPSRSYQQRQNYRPPNFFQPTGPRNFVTQELTNVETYVDNPYDEPYLVEYPFEPYQEPSLEENLTNNTESQANNLPPNYRSQDSSDFYELEQNFENSQEKNPENFCQTASVQELT